MFKISEIPEGSYEADACFQVVSDDQSLTFRATVSTPRNVKEQVANHLERLKQEAATENITFLGIETR